MESSFELSMHGGGRAYLVAGSKNSSEVADATQRRIRCLELEAQCKLHAPHRGVGGEVGDLSSIAAIDAT